MGTGITNSLYTNYPAVSAPDLKKVQAVDHKVDIHGTTADAHPKLSDPIGVESQQQNALSKEELAKVIKQVNTAFQDEKRSIQFSIDEESGRTIIKVLDSNTGKEIRQFPSEDILEISRNITAQLNKRDEMTGVLLPGKNIA